MKFLCCGAAEAVKEPRDPEPVTTPKSRAKPPATGSFQAALPPVAVPSYSNTPSGLSNASPANVQLKQPIPADYQAQALYQRPVEASRAAQIPTVQHAPPAPPARVAPPPPLIPAIKPPSRSHVPITPPVPADSDSNRGSSRAPSQLGDDDAASDLSSPADFEKYQDSEEDDQMMEMDPTQEHNHQQHPQHSQQPELQHTSGLGSWGGHVSSSGGAPLPYSDGGAPESVARPQIKMVDISHVAVSVPDGLTGQQTGGKAQVKQAATQRDVPDIITAVPLDRLPVATDHTNNHTIPAPHVNTTTAPAPRLDPIPVVARPAPGPASHEQGHPAHSSGLAPPSTPMQREAPPLSPQSLHQHLPKEQQRPIPEDPGFEVLSDDHSTTEVQPVETAAPEQDLQLNEANPVTSVPVPVVHATDGPSPQRDPSQDLGTWSSADASPHSLDEQSGVQGGEPALCVSDGEGKGAVKLPVNVDGYARVSAEGGAAMQVIAHKEEAKGHDDAREVEKSVTNALAVGTAVSTSSKALDSTLAASSVAVAPVVQAADGDKSKPAKSNVATQPSATAQATPSAALPPAPPSFDRTSGSGKDLPIWARTTSSRAAGIAATTATVTEIRQRTPPPIGFGHGPTHTPKSKPKAQEPSKPLTKTTSSSSTTPTTTRTSASPTVPSPASSASKPSAAVKTTPKTTSHTNSTTTVPNKTTTSTADSTTTTSHTTPHRSNPASKTTTPTTTAKTTGATAHKPSPATSTTTQSSSSKPAAAAAAVTTPSTQKAQAPGPVASVASSTTAPNKEVPTTTTTAAATAAAATATPSIEKDGPLTARSSKSSTTASEVAKDPDLNQWRLIRLTQAQPCAAQHGTVQQETVDGETEVFQCDQTLGVGALAAVILSAAGGKAEPRLVAFCPDPLCLGSCPTGLEELPKCPVKIPLGTGAKLTRSEFNHLQELGVGVSAPKAPPKQAT